MCARQKVNTFLVTGSRSQARKKKEEWPRQRSSARTLLARTQWTMVRLARCANNNKCRRASVCAVPTFEIWAQTEQSPSTDRAQTRPSQARPRQTTADQTRPDSTRPDQRPESVPARGKALRSALLATPLCHWLIFAAANNLTCAIVVAVAGVGYILETFGARHVLVLAVTYI